MNIPYLSCKTTRIGVELAAVQRKLPDCVVVGLQLYSARTFSAKRRLIRVETMHDGGFSSTVKFTRIAVEAGQITVSCLYGSGSNDA